MIRIGLNANEKQKEIDIYLSKNKIRKIFVLYFKKFKPNFNVACEIEYVEYKDIIEYPFFYRLLEEIDNECLIIVDECMRTRNRSELTYNCAHHYLNQTKHKIIFEYFPFIEDEKDFLILLDFQNKGKYKGKGFDWEFLKEEDVKAKPITFSFTSNMVDITEEQIQSYETKKEELFNNLGNKDPDTIPRNLHLFVGKFKKPYIEDNLNYVARNKRFNLKNVETFKNTKKEKSIFLDFPYRQLDLNDYLKKTKNTNIEFLSTGLPVDEYYKNKFKDWLERLGEFYAKASLCK